MLYPINEREEGKTVETQMTLNSAATSSTRDSQSSLKLVSISKERKAAEILYELLLERGPHESISHKSMPTLDEHRKFVESNPYQCWYLIKLGDEYVGAVYISRQREIGVGVMKAHRQKGVATAALKMLIDKWPGHFLANINPDNVKSIHLFSQLGFRHIQNTYRRDR